MAVADRGVWNINFICSMYTLLSAGFGACLTIHENLFHLETFSSLFINQCSHVWKQPVAAVIISRYLILFILFYLVASADNLTAYSRTYGLTKEHIFLVHCTGRHGCMIHILTKGTRRFKEAMRRDASFITPISWKQWLADIFFCSLTIDTAYLTWNRYHKSNAYCRLDF